MVIHINRNDCESALAAEGCGCYPPLPPSGWFWGMGYGDSGNEPKTRTWLGIDLPQLLNNTSGDICHEMF